MGRRLDVFIGVDMCMGTKGGEYSKSPRVTIYGTKHPSPKQAVKLGWRKRRESGS